MARCKDSLEKCKERYLLACKHCYSLDPVMIAELAPGESCCDCCGGQEHVFLHENTMKSKNNKLFHEYQIIRERKSDTLANGYCRYRDSCKYGEQRCRFVHTFYEMKVWRMESDIMRNTFEREDLVHEILYSAPVFHCPFCALNFEDNANYTKHLSSRFHNNMRKHFQSIEDTTWKYGPCKLSDPKKCERAYGSPESCNCDCAHTERQFAEWKNCCSVYKARNSFVEEGIDYLKQMEERIKRGDVVEIQHLYIRHPAFQVKCDGINSEFVRHVPLLGGKYNKLNIQVQFQNPGVYGQHSGKLFLDYGETSIMQFLDFRATIRATDTGKISTRQQQQLSELTCQDWCVNRIIIDFPTTPSHEGLYEANLKELELKYPEPRAENLNDVHFHKMDPKTYPKHMHNFLYKEERARQDVLSRLNLECELTFSNHVTIPNGTLLGSKGDGSLFAHFQSPVRLSIDSDEGSLARKSCSKVLVGLREDSFAYECKIEAWENKEVFLNVSAKCVNDLQLEAGSKLSLAIQFKLDRQIFCVRHHTIDCLEERVQLICPGRKVYANVEKRMIYLRNLDSEQNSVLMQIFGTKQRNFLNPGKSSYPPTLVAGPFGTGKTHTIRNTILQILKDKDSDSKILLCTHSNSAADLYIKDICASGEWDNEKPKILRIFYHGRSIRTVLNEDVLKFCLYTADLRSFRYPKLKELRKYRLIITTFSTAPALGQLGVGLRAGAFSHIFLDEASQAMEPEVIIPLTLASAEHTRIIVAGDHKQINERTFLQGKAAIPTLLERMYKAYEDEKCLHQYRILLCNNYRCVDGLLQLISELFYKKGILKSTGEVKCIENYHPIHFTHVQGTCLSADGGEFINESEALQTVEEVKKLCYQTSVKPEEILVASPYYSQVTRIRQLLRKNHLSLVTVYTAANIQALQYRVVILSCVMTRVACLGSQGNNFGFLSVENLLNTVLTRARSLVIAIGDAVTLCTIGNCAKKWEIYLQHCEKFNTIHPDCVRLDDIREKIRVAKLSLRPGANQFIPASETTIALSSGTEISTWNPTGLDDGKLGSSSHENRISTNNCDSSSEESDDNDDILKDMQKKSSGKASDTFTHSDTDLETSEDDDPNSETSEDEDPNEIHLTSATKYAAKGPIFPKHNIGELENMLESDPDTYKRCRIHMKTYHLAEAIELSKQGNKALETVIVLDGREKIGRTFNNDEVVVKLEQENGRKIGQVMGTLKRYRNPRKGHFLCKPDENNSAVMIPIEKACTKFAIKTPPYHKYRNPGTIPLYKPTHKTSDFTGLDLVSREKIKWECLYRVKYLKWSEYCPYPHGYVDEIVPTSNVEECMKHEFDFDEKKKSSIIDQARKTKIPKASSGDIISIFTIDPEGAKDIDDGLSLSICEEHKFCHVLGIHVTDVATLLPEDSPIDLLAKKGQVTFYGGVDATKHLLPEKLSTNKFSLLENKRRAAISTFFHSTVLPPHLHHANQYVEPEKKTVMSKKQLSYKEAEKILCLDDDDDDDDGNPESIEFQLKKIWEILWIWRICRLDGAAYYQDHESYDKVITEGRSHLLIEEAMLAFNANAARYLVSKGWDIQLRVQEIPELKEWKEWRNSNRLAIRNSMYLLSSSEYIRDRQEEERNFHRVPESLQEQIDGDLSVPTRMELDQNYDGSLAEGTDSYEWSVEIYASVWRDIVRFFNEGDYIKGLMILSMDYLHPSQVSALDHSLKDSVKKLMVKFEVAQFAKKLQEQPDVQDVCVSMITDAGLRIFFPRRHDCLPSRMRQLDFGHLMLDMDNADFLKNVKDDHKKRNRTDDLILDKIPAKWRFRYYNYEKSISEESIRSRNSGVCPGGLTIKITKDSWQNLIGAMGKLPEWSSSDTAKKTYETNVRKAISRLKLQQTQYSLMGNMSGETRNAPKKILHHRVIEKTLTPGSVLQVQLSSWCGRDRLLEPCIQLLILANDLSVCVHHNHEPLLTFARDAKPKDIRPLSLKEYQRAWEPLIRLDSAYNAVTDGSSIILSDVKIQWKTKNSLLTEIVNQVNSNSFECQLEMTEHKFELQANFCRDRYLELHRNDLLCLRLPGIPNTKEVSHKSFSNFTSHTIVLHGTITSVDGKHIPDISIFQDAENLWTIEVIPLSFMHRHIQGSLSMLTKTKNKLLESIALKREIDANVIDHLPRAAHYLLTQRQFPGFLYELNDRQQEEKNHCIKQKFTVIQGPPGTGKSLLGAQIAASFAEINRKNDSKNPKKVLYCGPSNKAVDVAAKFLKEARGLKVVRMYSASLEDKVYPNPLKPPPVMQRSGDESKKPDQQLKSIALHELVRKNGKPTKITAFDKKVKDESKKFKREEVDEYKKAVMKAKQEELAKCDIIICTCSLSAQLSLFKDEQDQEMKFAQCIIDECGMCSEPETMVPLMTSNPEQVVLIGDHKQLQPIIKCKKAERLGLGESLFSKYSKSAGMLTLQYRMDQDIMMTPSQIFYDGKLRAHQSIFQRKEISFFNNTNHNNVFWHVQGTEMELKFRSVRGGRKSKYNMEEAKAVVKLLKYLTSDAKVKLKPSEIMVLSPYTAQCNKIQYRLKQTSMNGQVHVGSVVTSQGSEANFVILSTVRSMPEELIRENHGEQWERAHLGFISDPHKVNVALTRAKRGLCIIGNKHLLKSNKNWNTIIEKYEKNGAVHDGDDLVSGSNWSPETHYVDECFDDEFDFSSVDEYDSYEESDFYGESSSDEFFY